ncbi:hypothetical protein A2U01_0053835, partial [Trifolium medium]|nr:hypothetical protein [Trifolium medium]
QSATNDGGDCLLSLIGVLKDHRRRNSSLLTAVDGVKQIGRPETQTNHLEEDPIPTTRALQSDGEPEERRQRRFKRT